MFDLPPARDPPLEGLGTNDTGTSSSISSLGNSKFVSNSNRLDGTGNCPPVENVVHRTQPNQSTHTDNKQVRALQRNWDKHSHTKYGCKFTMALSPIQRNNHADISKLHKSQWDRAVAQNGEWQEMERLAHKHGCSGGNPDCEIDNANPVRTNNITDY